MPEKKLACNPHKMTKVGRRNKLTRELWEKILEDLEQTGNMEACAANNGIDSSTLYTHMRKNPEMREEADMARHKACLLLEQEAWRRAVEGTDKAVYHQGCVVGYEKEYSDKLLEKLLVANRPDRFSNKTSVDVTHTHEVGSEAKSKLSALLGLTEQSNEGDVVDGECEEVDD